MAKIAVSAATYWIDKPYEYYVPEVLIDTIRVGCRVFVPFSRSNRKCEGVVLSVEKSSEDKELKDILSILDSNPVLTPEQIQLALFMRDRYFCTIYDALKAMLPVGLWINDAGGTRVKDKYVEFARLDIDGNEAARIADDRRKKAPQQANLLTELAVFGRLPSRELLLFTGAAKTSLKALVNDELVVLEKCEVFRRPDFKFNSLSDLPILNSEQKEAFSYFKNTMQAESFSVSLLQGVTGSGKTAVYIHLIKFCIDSGKDAILLVPEISLTPQMLQTFASYFGDDIAVLHSSLTAGERYDEWKRVKTGKAHLVIGTRSAIFAPCDNLGLIIIDEEQEDTYKSENTPRYNAEEIAKFRCHKASCMLLLGSATPRISSRYYAQLGKYGYRKLAKRYNNMELPSVTVVDMKEELKNGNDSNISSFLKDEITRNIENGEQSILFLNRRGANKVVTCGECGYIYSCPNCSVSLTYHSYSNKLICHYCGYRITPDSRCPDCGGILKYIGAGTQLVESELKQLFPDSEILRMDTDVITRSVTHEQLFERFKTEKIPIMIGTQMVTKGLNFDNVTLVGVISADQSLYSSDYRASERTFSLLTQVIGRSGRFSKPGRAVIQTFTPNNKTILQSSKQDYDAFYESEILSRQAQMAPPFSDLLCITVSGDDENAVYNACKYVKARLSFLLNDLSDYELLGPTPLMVVKVNKKYRYRINVKCTVNSTIRKAISLTITECCKDKRFKNMLFFADSDPVD